MFKYLFEVPIDEFDFPSGETGALKKRFNRICSWIPVAGTSLIIVVHFDRWMWSEGDDERGEISYLGCARPRVKKREKDVSLRKENLSTKPRIEAISALDWVWIERRGTETRTCGACDDDRRALLPSCSQDPTGCNALWMDTIRINNERQCFLSILWELCSSRGLWQLCAHAFMILIISATIHSWISERSLSSITHHDQSSTH